jgi:hypothetical protein
MAFQLTGELKGTANVGVILPTHREAENIKLYGVNRNSPDSYFISRYR